MKLNAKQKQAVDTIDGPLLVIAGPGTGKTELLSMRTANILDKTDTLPNSILLLTFTESGATAMRERLVDIIGADAYKVAIHTFHSFGTEIINQNAEYFFRGAQFKPADELAQYEILRGIFSELDYINPLAGMNGDEYTHLRDTMSTISELKRSGLTSDELRKIIAANEVVVDQIESHIAAVFSVRISSSTAEKLAPIAKQAAELPQPELPSAITPYANVLALSIAHAVDASIEADSTKPITAWKNMWCEKNADGDIILKDRRRHDKLRAVAHVYYQYITRMEAAGLFDYDDMILEVIHTMETRPDLRANLQEKYQYILVDEFQDTNLAQLRLLFNVTGEQEKPNVMAVGDDDQAIYSFQGADIGNIQRFRTQYSDPEIIVLTDNYRSAPGVLTAAREVIQQGLDRLEHSNESIDKSLTPHQKDPSGPAVELHEYADIHDERSGLAKRIRSLIDSGTAPETIAILARRHNELVELLPYLHAESISVDYERRENVLEHEIVRLLEHLLMIIDALHRDAHDEADALLPEILAHPAFGYDPRDIYKLSLASYRNHQLWLEAMQVNPVFQPFADWLIVRTAAVHVESLEQQIDELLGSGNPDRGNQIDGHSAFPAEVGQDKSSASDRPSDRGMIDEGRKSAGSQPSDDESSAFPAELDQENSRLRSSELESADGRESAVIEARSQPYRSPLYNYFFSDEKLADQPDAYLTALEALRTIRDQLREHYGHSQPTVQTFLEFLQMHRELGSTITAVRRRDSHGAGRVNMMTVHKSKGLEFEHVFVIGAVDSAWGEKVRTRSRLVGYPANLPLAPAGDSLDERLRLFFVAMTRAKQTLRISYSTTNSAGKDMMRASFLADSSVEPIVHEHTDSLDEQTKQLELDWRGTLARSVDDDLRQLLAPTLETYKLSATHLGNFLDISQGGPSHFLLSNLLRFPQAKSPNAVFGTAIHSTLQRAHDFYRAMGEKRPLEDLLADYERILRDMHLSEVAFESFYTRGIDSLSAYLSARYDTFTQSQKTEVGFGAQGVVIGDARLTGALDLVDIDPQAKTIFVTDYKTGKPSRDWKGRTEYEKIKLHKYRQQLMFYQLLCENSRDYSSYGFLGGRLQFVEPSQSGDILELEESFSSDELNEFKQLIAAVWRAIISLDLPDTTGYEPTLKGIKQFEQDLIDKES